MHTAKGTDGSEGDIEVFHRIRLVGKNVHGILLGACQPISEIPEEVYRVIRLIGKFHCTGLHLGTALEVRMTRVNHYRSLWNRLPNIHDCPLL